MLRWTFLFFWWASAARAENPPPSNETSTQPVVAVPVVDVPMPAAPSQDRPTSPQAREPTGVISSIDKKSGSASKDAAELISRAPSTVVSSYAGVGHTSTVSVRGAAANGTLVLLDGIPLGGPGESVDISTLPTAAIERVEVLRGGARYGPGALGGVVNLVTISPRNGAHVLTQATYGAFETMSASAGATGELLGGKSLALVYGFSTQGNFTYAYRPLPELPNGPVETRVRENNYSQIGGLLLRHHTPVLSDSELDLLVDGAAYGRGLAGTIENPTPDALEQGQRLTASGQLHNRFKWGGKLSTLAYVRTRRSRFVGGFASRGLMTQVDTGAGIEANYSQLVYGWHGVSATISGGVDTLSAAATTAPLWPKAAAMLRDEVLLFDGDLTVDASVRFDTAGPYQGFTPKLGVLWLLPKGFEVKANLGQSWRAPSFVERYVALSRTLPNPELKPERGLYGDAALAFRKPQGVVQLSGFIARYENLISFEYYPPLLARPVNFAAAQVSGLELEAQWHPWNWLSASVSYGFLHTQNLKDDPRYYLKPLPYRPEHKLITQLNVGPSWLQARGEIIYQTEQLANRTASRILPARTFVNLGASWTALTKPDVRVSLELANLFDVQGMDIDGYPLPPRAGYLTFHITLDPIPERKS